MTSRRSAALIALCIVGLLGSGFQRPVSTEFTDDDRKAIRKALDKASRALVAKDFAEWADLYTIDAVALHPTGDKVEGRAALERWASPGTALEYQARATEIEGRADLAYLRGSFSMRVTVTNRPVLEQGEFIQIWRKQSDGEWKVTHEMFTSDLLKWPS